MAEKKVSKGNMSKFIEDAIEDPKLYNQMMAVIKTKGKGLTPGKFMEKFHRLGYEGVSMQDAKSTLATLRKLKNPESWDWHY